MNRCVAFLLALCCAGLTVSSVSIAQAPEWVHFTLDQAGGRTELQASFRADDERHHNNWSSSFRPSELTGFDAAGFRAGGTRPLRFAVVRDAGRLDCAGHGGDSYAAGTCSVTPSAQFLQLLDARGIRRPSREETFGLISLDVRRELIDAVAAAHYPTPTIEQLIELTAVGVDARYIADLARLGYRPSALHNLVEFRAMGITPEWIGGFARMGYADIPADQLVQLKALDISPEFARWAVGERRSLPSVSTLVQMKIFDPRQ
jgi:hypothetical protein